MKRLDLMFRNPRQYYKSSYTPSHDFLQEMGFVKAVMLPEEVMTIYELLFTDETNFVIAVHILRGIYERNNGS